ncbi:MAG: RNA polymerase sigma factor [Flavipsychrobacter sp.]|nr:RNA polymerase sigma factor [Flavipsychrobacter sp.]
MTATDFDRMVVLHSEFLRPYAVSLTHSQEDAKDLFQETMVRALLNRDKYQFGTNLKAWLYTIMRNVFINNYRKNKKHRKVDDQAPESYIYTMNKTAQNDGWAHMRINEIKEAIDNLPNVFRLSFELHYTGYKYQEIADLLHEPLGTIKSRIHFARKQLVENIER